MFQREYLVPRGFDQSMLRGSIFKSRCLSIIDHISTALHRKNKEFGYVNIHSETLKGLASDNYRLYLTALERMEVIKINNHYSNNDFASKGCFSKSYRFTSRYREGFMVILSDGHTRNRKIRDLTDKSDSICVDLAKNCRLLKIDRSKLIVASYQIRKEAGALVAGLESGSVNVKRGRKVKRIYHRINRASKELRKLLILDGSKLVEYDMKSAHPVLAISLYADCTCAESQKYKELLKVDIYSDFDLPRDVVKKHFRKFFYGKRHNIRKDGSSANPVANYFRINFPILYNEITSSENLAVTLQNFESYLFNDFIIPRARDLRLFYISIHDGYMTDSIEAAVTIRHLIVRECESRIGFAPEVNLKTEEPLPVR